jgi:hypothetical protein
MDSTTQNSQRKDTHVSFHKAKISETFDKNPSLVDLNLNPLLVGSASLYILLSAIKVAYAMKHVHRNVRSIRPNVDKEVEKYRQRNSQITKYRATRNLLKTELNLGPPKMDFYQMFHLFLPCEN